ncbi:MAG TPA: hypothetical protein VGR23_07670 [Candidatus Dormibacteraeota bacterium]|nr:hypothetical protein [Candidatus Dormibacteraeota bacterium]
MLAAVLGGVGALVAGRFARPDAASAAAGDPLIIGSVINNAGTSNTQLLANSTDVSFRLVQSGLGTALMGQVTPTVGNGRGVYGRTDSPDGDGVQARNGATGAGAGAGMRAFGGLNHGVVASTTNNGKYAVHATGANGTAIYGTAIQEGVHGDGYRGVVGTTSASGAAAGVHGRASGTSDVYGVFGYTNALTGNGRGVYGLSASNDSNGIGVYGSRPGIGLGTVGNSTDGSGLYGTSTNWYGLWVDGPSQLNGNANVTGTLTKSAGSFKIDHPLDPANKWLFHSFVESPDMKNVYDGVATLDANGEATISLPAYFDALNRDTRYQLTAIGRPAPDLHVKSEAKNNAFSIAGGTAGQKVSWQVTGIRQDAYARAHPIEVEVAKSSTDKGRYLHPTEHKVAKSKGLTTSPTGAKG